MARDDYSEARLARSAPAEAAMDRPSTQPRGFLSSKIRASVEHSLRSHKRAPSPAANARAGALRCKSKAYASAPSWRLRVTLGSTGMPGPIVVATETFFRYLPLAADGLLRSTSSSTAA